MERAISKPRVATAYLSMALLLFGVVRQAEAIDYSRELPVRLGEWNWNFAEAKALADEQSIPMVLFWGGAQCPVCKNLEAAVGNDQFVSWQQSRKLVMVFQSGTAGDMYEFTRNPSGSFPYICVYWKRSDGSATTNRFSGVVRGALPWPATGASSVEHFINSVEKFIGDYQPAENNSGDFVVGDTENDRLEAVPGKTAFVSVPLSRTRASVPHPAINSIVVTYPRKQGVETNEVVWAEGEETKYPKVEFATSVTLLPNEEITLDLLDSQGQLVGTRHIWLVEDPENSPKNPYWIGEKTVDTLGWGEWTADIEVATNKVAAAADSAWTLIGIVGSLWCPDCFRVDEYFLSDPAVKSWAEMNHVAFVAADIPNIGRSDVPVTLRYAASASGVSGAGYLSRHGVEIGDATACLERNYYFAQSLFHRPEDTNKNRTGVPIFVLLNKQGEMVGRFTRLANKSPTDSSHNAAYITRLSEMIAQAGDADEMGNNHYSTTATELFANGEAHEGQISQTDAVDTLRIVGVESGSEVTIAAEAADAQRNVAVGLTVLEVLDGASRVIASTNGVLGGLTVAAQLDTKGAEWFVQISAAALSTDPSDPFSAENEGGTITPYSLAVSGVVLVPGETKSANKAADGGAEVVLRLAEGENYRFAGLAAEGWEENLELIDEERGIYRSLSGGDVMLPVSQVGGELEYQVWRPGEVAFLDTGLELTEKAGLVEISVVRTNGVSGAASVSVAADLSGVAPGRLVVGQCDEAGDFAETTPALEWAEGEDGARTFWIRVLDDEADDGDQSAVLSLTNAANVIVADGRGSLAIVLAEDDLPLPGRLAIVDVYPVASKDWTVYAPAGSEVIFTIARLGGAEGEASAALQLSVDGKAVEGDDVYDYIDGTEFTWQDKCRGEESVKDLELHVPDWAVGKTISVSFTGSVARADPSARRLKVVVYDDEAPSFADRSVSYNAVKTSKFSADIPTSSAEGEVLKATKLSGSLPSGLKATFDRGVLSIAGTPTRAGTYAATYRVWAVRGDVSVPGGTVTVAISVSEAKEICPALAKSRTFRDLQMVDGDSRRLVGLLTLTIPPSGRVSASYACSEGRLGFTASGWEYDEDSSTFSAVLRCSRAAYSSYRLYVDQYADGTVRVEMFDPQFPLNLLVREARAEDAWSRTASSDAWQGQYTVACLYSGYKAIVDSDAAYFAHSTGSACFTMKLVSRSAINSGRVMYAGWLANGLSVSGSSVAARDGDGGIRVPIYMRASKDFFSAVCLVEKGAKANWEANHGGETGFGQRAITAPDDVDGWWTHREKTDDATFSCRYAVYGSYWEPTADIGAVMEKTGVETTADFATDLAEMPESPSRGAVVEGGVPEALIMVGKSDIATEGDVALRLDSRTGVASGAFRAIFEGGAVNVTVRAVALPGWTGCGCHGEPLDLPFLHGSGWFSDRVYYKEPDALRDRTWSVGMKRGCKVTAETRIPE